jgi:ATP-binding cassette, subfamily B, bacterial
LGVNRQTLSLYWQQVRHHKPSFFIMLLCIPTGSLLIDTLLPYFLSLAIGDLANGEYQTITQNLILGGAIGLLGALMNLLGFQAMTRHEANILARLNDSTFKKLINKDHFFFVNQKLGAMTTRYIDFVRSEVSIQDLFIIRTMGFLLSVGGGIVILASQSLVVTLIVLLLIVGLVLQIRWSTKKRAPWRHTRRKLRGEIYGNVADALTNNLIVKTFAGEERETASLQKLTRRFRDVYRKDIGFMAYEGSVRVAAMVIVQIIAIVVSVQMVMNDALPVATAIFMLAYLQRIGSQLFVLGEIINGYDQAFLDASHMTEMLTQEADVSDKPDAKELSNFQPSITFDKISYKYNDGTDNVINNIGLEIPAGQKVGLVGHSGAGKTTITHLLLRFSDVTSGAIKIDGQDIRDVTQESLRKNIAYVPQEPMLFHRTLRENIAYGKPDATDGEIHEAAQKAHAAEFIDKLPNGYDTVVGERGVKLSGGQRQRIAIARAILKDAPILVLDEATSALDSESEKLIQKALWELMKGRTAIVIAHRLSTIQRMDRILVLENGDIAEQGSHKELLRHKGIYHELWSHQSGGFIEE